jgi:hypothetical protein
MEEFTEEEELIHAKDFVMLAEDATWLAIAIIAEQERAQTQVTASPRKIA